MVEPRSYRSFTIVQLAALLKQRLLPVTGLKNDLILRLQADDEQDKLQSSTGNRVTSRVTYRGISCNQQDPESNSSTARNGHLSEPTSDNTQIEQQKMLERLQRDNLVLWRQPLTTIQYFFLECTLLVRKYGSRLFRSWRLAMACVVLAVCLFAAYNIDGPHQENVLYIEKKVTWCLYWVGLGILSSVGLGTGLHTFVLYLGPHIASVTLAAFECNSVEFPEPPYPNQIICPAEGYQTAHITLWTIMSKVRLEAMMWGAGTAIGELPPYFMARAARLSGQDSEDDEFEELEELLVEQQTHPQDMNFLERAKLGVHRLVQRVGFFGILLCASIPNPLFDLAGITCGHFLIPFWTFFGATLIGKAIIKMHIQKLFVIFAFSEHHVQMLVDLLRYIPTYGETLQAPFREYLAGQKLKLHHKPGDNSVPNPQASWLSWAFEKLIIVMVVYFLVSIVNSMAQSYHKTLCKDKRHKTKEMKA